MVLHECKNVQFWRRVDELQAPGRSAPEIYYHDEGARSMLTSVRAESPNDGNSGSADRFHGDGM